MIKHFGTCCENLVEYAPVHVSIVGSLLIDGEFCAYQWLLQKSFLIVSKMRDGKAIYEGEGVKTILTNDGMTIGTYIKFPSLVRSGTCKVCLESAKG